MATNFLCFGRPEDNFPIKFKAREGKWQSLSKVFKTNYVNIK